MKTTNINDREAELSAAEQKTVDLLAASRIGAPVDFAARVMQALPARPDRSRLAMLRLFWPEQHQWLLPALAGAAAVLLAVFGWSLLGPVQVPAPAAVLHVELHAPGAQKVELVGDFTQWQSGRIELRGPDASGHWTASVPLPPGRHEYLFLVDGRQWLTDPRAEVRRPDGFGHQNAVVDL